jgi:hypothetical protein
MHRSLIVGGYCLIVSFAWLTLWRLVLLEDVAARGMTSSYGLLTWFLLIAAPAATFIPLAHLARAPLYDLEGWLGWSSLLAMLAFLEPAERPTLAQFLLFLIPLTVAIASVASAGSYLIGLRVYRFDPRRHDFMRARRQGYLTAVTLIAVGLLRGAGTLTPATGTLIVAIAFLTEMLLLTRTGRVEVAYDR